VHRSAPLPPFAGRSFRRWADRHRPPQAAKSVVYFHGCSTNYFEPRLGEMTVAVLEHNGFNVIIPRQGCCGLPLQSNGSFLDARSKVRRLARALAPYARQDLPVIATSTSCGLMLKREAHEILELENEELLSVGAKVYDICEFLLELHDAGQLRTDFKPLHLTVPYHAPCQQRGHGIGKPALDLFALIPALETIELDVECCGIAGTYGLKREKYDIAMKVGSPLFTQIRDSSPDLAACDSETCRWQIAHGSGVEVVHPVEVLYRAYGLGDG
jgi:glycerol-3-phosphate dehydrogenase subunit C